MRLPAVTLLTVALAAGCGSPPLTNTQPTGLDLAQAVLKAFERRDIDALNALAVTEEEFRTHVWPELPASRPERNVPFAYVWNDHRQKSNQLLEALLAQYGGQSFTLINVEYAGRIRRFSSLVLRGDTILTVRAADGSEQRLRLYGSILEKDGAFKVFSYIVD